MQDNNNNNDNNDENRAILLLQDFAFRLYGHALIPQVFHQVFAAIRRFPYLKHYVLDRQSAPLHQLCHSLDKGVYRYAVLPIIHSLIDIDSSCLLVQDIDHEIPLISLFQAIAVAWRRQDLDHLVLHLMERMIQAQPSTLAHTNPLNGCTISHTLIAFGNPPEVVRSILSHAPNLAGSLNQPGKLPLHLACEMEYDRRPTAMETIRLLVEANPTGIITKDVHDKTPLHYACCNPHLPMEAIQLMANTQPNALSILSIQRLPYHAYVIAEQDKDNQKSREDMIAMMRLHMIHGLEHVLLLTPEPNMNHAPPDGHPRQRLFPGRRLEPLPPAFMACARDLLKQELLVREELRWTKMVTTELPQGKSPIAAADIFWNWTKERKQCNQKQLQTIVIKLRDICCFDDFEL